VVVVAWFTALDDSTILMVTMSPTRSAFILTKRVPKSLSCCQREGTDIEGAVWIGGPDSVPPAAAADGGAGWSKLLGVSLAVVPHPNSRAIMSALITMHAQADLLFTV
jgi:hypothetical protein